MRPTLSLHAAVACGLASFALGAAAAPVATKQTLGKPPTIWDVINNPTKL
ncbi:hypothetical protein NX784_24175 [Massilia pinisoli]|uniref:Uncharacterized protein n=1 Tax=Massilia pinisoli TaxID=1772194 RepID=A0ABT1ZXP0_9BURK|nr:hypothetical protein [Massilia pinisoli]MCS0584687.1 hypothetical protein [Massilia pinisoli]